MDLIRTQKFYGFLHFQPCIIDHPEKETTTKLAIGNRTLSFRTKNVYKREIDQLNVFYKLKTVYLENLEISR
jgi:hypothetical protein